MDINEIGSMVKKKRKAYGLTQKEAAGLCNVGVRFLSELENGKPLRLVYTAKYPVEATVRVNDLFRVRTHPHILDGKIPVLLHLTDPRGKALEDCPDLHTFWSDRYPALRRRLLQLHTDVPWP